MQLLPDAPTPRRARSVVPTLMSQPAFIYTATRGNFTRLVLENSRRGLVLVDFWAPWVGASLRQREMLVALAEEYRGCFLLVTVNTDEQKQIAGDYGVRSLPLCKLFRHGRVVETLHGVQHRADYREAVERHLGAPASPAQQAALPPEARDQPRIARMLSHLESLVTAAEAPPWEEVAPALECDLGSRQGAARRRLEAVFDGLEKDDPRVKPYRTEFCRLAYRAAEPA